MNNSLLHKFNGQHYILRLNAYMLRYLMVENAQKKNITYNNNKKREQQKISIDFYKKSYSPQCSPVEMIYSCWKWQRYEYYGPAIINEFLMTQSVFEWNVSENWPNVLFMDDAFESAKMVRYRKRRRKKNPPSHTHTHIHCSSIASVHIKCSTL